MSYDLQTDAWLPVKTWNPNTIVDTTCRKFIFYHFRPVGWQVEIAELNAQGAAESFIVQPEQVSLILNVVPGFFQCVTVKSTNASDFKSRLLLAEYMELDRQGKAKLWKLDTNNFFRGAYEVFNGPNPIDITKP